MRNKIVLYLIILFTGTLLAQSCSTTKKGCGCGSDINRVYKPKRFH